MDVSAGHSPVRYVMNWTYFRLDALGQHWESGGKTKFQMRQSTHDVKSPCHWLSLYGSENWTVLEMFCVTVTSLSMIFCFHEPITEDVDEMELWWQTWLVTSVWSATSPVRTAHCHWIELNSTAQAHRSSDKLVTLAVSSAQSAAPSRTSPLVPEALSPLGRSRALNLNLLICYFSGKVIRTWCMMRK